MNIDDSQIPQGLHILSKPIGSVCNLDCEYCFYLEKDSLNQKSNKFRMSDEILEAYIKNYIKNQPTEFVEFVWHGGEPTIIGLEFFEKAMEFQKKHNTNKKITNSIQTNGNYLTRKWCKFLKTNNFIVGLSLDGPKEIHNIYRYHKNGKGSFEETFKALKLLQKYNVEVNILACIGKETAKYPLEIYNFFKKNKVKYIQFTPIIERIPDSFEKSRGQTLSGPANLEKCEDKLVTSWSVEPKEYANFLIKITDEWIRKDVGEIFIMNFESALTQYIGNHASSCIHARQCGKNLAVENDGSVYACDHYVYPEYKLGNVKDKSLYEMSNESIQKEFGREKETKLTSECKNCNVLQLCWGGCPKHRFEKTIEGKNGLSYMCEGYKTYFNYIINYLEAITKLLVNGYNANYIMQAIDRPLVLKKIDN